MQKVLIVLYKNCKKMPGKAKPTSVTREDKENSDYGMLKNSGILVIYLVFAESIKKLNGQWVFFFWCNEMCFAYTLQTVL
jgi:hypothetical protein